MFFTVLAGKCIFCGFGGKTCIDGNLRFLAVLTANTLLRFWQENVCFAFLRLWWEMRFYIFCEKCALVGKCIFVVLARKYVLRFLRENLFLRLCFFGQKMRFCGFGGKYVLVGKCVFVVLTGTCFFSEKCVFDKKMCFVFLAEKCVCGL